MDANLHFAFLFGLHGKRCKQIERRAVHLQQPQRVPTGAHDEVGAGIDHPPQPVRSRIDAIAQYDFTRLVAQALKVLAAMLVGQFKLIDLPLGKVVADMQAPCRAIGSRLADRCPSRARKR